MAGVYATVADLILAYDSRRVAELASDTDTPVASGSLATDAVLLRMLADGANLIQLAARFADRYSQADLDAVYADPINKYSIIRLNVDLAFGLLVARRGYRASELADLAPNWVIANQTLELLRLGNRVFDVASAPEAGAAVDTVKLGQNGCSFVTSAFRMYGPLSVGATRPCCPSAGSNPCGC